MAKQVEETLQRILGEAKGGSADTEGAQEVRLLKERNRVSWRSWRCHIMLITHLSDSHRCLVIDLICIRLPIYPLVFCSVLANFTKYERCARGECVNSFQCN